MLIVLQLQGTVHRVHYQLTQGINSSVLPVLTVVHVCTKQRTKVQMNNKCTYGYVHIYSLLLYFDF